MGQFSSTIFKIKDESVPCSMLNKLAADGDIISIQELVGKEIASYSTSGLSCSKDPKLESFVDRTDKDGNSALMFAIVSGHFVVVRFLIESCGANIIIQNQHKFTPFWLSCGYGKIDILKYLMDRVLNNSEYQNTKESSTSSSFLWQILMLQNNSGDTPFCAAVSRNNYDICQLLIKKAREQDSATLHAREGPLSFSTVKELLWCENDSGDTPLSVAVGYGHDGPLLDLLLGTEESVCKQIGVDKDSENRPLNMRNSNTLTPLLVACERNSDSIVKKLIEKGAKLFTRDSIDGRSPLAVAAFCSCKDVVKLLLSMDANVKIDINDQDRHGCTPIWLASRTGDIKMVKILFDAGADMEIRNKQDLNAYEVAVKFKKQSIIDFFSSVVKTK